MPKIMHVYSEKTKLKQNNTHTSPMTWLAWLLGSGKSTYIRFSVTISSKHGDCRSRRIFSDTARRRHFVSTVSWISETKQKWVIVTVLLNYWKLHVSDTYTEAQCKQQNSAIFFKFRIKGHQLRHVHTFEKCHYIMCTGAVKSHYKTAVAKESDTK